MNQKNILITGVLVLVVGAGAFYGGMKYDQGKSSANISQADFQNLRNLSPQERQQRLQAMGVNGSSQFGRGGRGVNSVVGEIIAKDDSSVTVKLNDGGSKTVFISGSTEISKSAAGLLSDLEIGKTISANGVPNSDGSVAATTIQIRPRPKQ